MTAPGRQLTIAEIGIGWRAYSAKRYYNDHTELPSPVGGIVLEIVHSTLVDTDTGEIAATTRYMVLDYRGDRHTLTDTELDLGCLEALDRPGCWTAADRLNAGIVRRRARRRGTWDDRDITDMRHVSNLLRAAL